jgi:hypothetical protein
MQTNTYMSLQFIQMVERMQMRIIPEEENERAWVGTELLRPRFQKKRTGGRDSYYCRQEKRLPLPYIILQNEISV